MKKMTIQKLLTWAFTEELCKADAGTGGDGLAMIANAWSAVSEVEALGTLIDRSPNGFGVIPAFIEDGEPHEDALKLAETVRTLTQRGFDIPAGWQPFPEWDDERGLIAAEVERVLAFERARGERRTGKHAYNLIVTCAVLGRGPDWHADRPKERLVMRQGKPAWFIEKRFKDRFGRWHTMEVDGMDRSGHRPKKGAYRKYELSDKLRASILSRIDWIVWQAALKMLERENETGLSRHIVEPMRFDFAPWAGNCDPSTHMQVIENAI